MDPPADQTAGKKYMGNKTGEYGEEELKDVVWGYCVGKTPCSLQSSSLQT